MKPLHPEIEQRLQQYRRDYEVANGRPFEHFFCPILAIDERAELIRGHVINKAYNGAPRTWVIQRADVDNFGSSAESVGARAAGESALRGRIAS